MNTVEQGKEMNVNEVHVTEWLPAYALNILTPDETASVTDHLANCASCQSELRSYQAVVDELPLALAQNAPRPALKNRLMKDIHTRKAEAAGANRLALRERWAAFFRRSVPVWATALVLLLVFGNLFFLLRLNQTNARNAGPMKVISLKGTQNAPGAVGTLVMNQSGEYGSLVVDNLAMLDSQHQYQVWLIKDGQRTNGGVFSVSPDGYSSLEINAPLPLNSYQSIGVTVEPAGGSPGPTGPKVLGANLR